MGSRGLTVLPKVLMHSLPASCVRKHECQPLHTCVPFAIGNVFGSSFKPCTQRFIPALLRCYIMVHLRHLPPIAKLQLIPYIKHSHSGIRGDAPCLCRVRCYLGHFLHRVGSSFRELQSGISYPYLRIENTRLVVRYHTKKHGPCPLHGKALILPSDATCS